MVPVVSFVGNSGVGKTTFLEKLIPVLKDRDTVLLHSTTSTTSRSTTPGRTHGASLRRAATSSSFPRLQSSPSLRRSKKSAD
jgi:molybdopterin-guanine dinucleotide biosynthesis protein